MDSIRCVWHCIYLHRCRHIVPQIFGPDFPEVFLLIVASAVLYGLAFAVMQRGY